MPVLLSTVASAVIVATPAAALGVPAVALLPEPPPVCYAVRTSVNATEYAPCVAPGGIQYEQGIYQPTYEGANPLVPLGTNPHVPYGTHHDNAG